MKLAVLFHRLGPYHHARLRAVAEAEQGDFVSIEFSGHDETYDWNVQEASQFFNNITLFNKTDIHRVSARDIRKKVFQVLNEVSPDVVAIPGWSERAALVALDWCIINRKRAVLMSDSTEKDMVRVWWKESIKKRIVKCCATALVAGKPHLDYVTKLGIPSHKIFTPYDVVDNSYFHELTLHYHAEKQEVRKNLNLPNPFFLSVNRFIEEKNIPRLLEAYALYCQKEGCNAHDFVLAGDGPLKTDISQLIKTLGIETKVRLPGFLQYSELPKYYAIADFFILASQLETWGLVVNEAMASKLPVLISKHCGCVSDLMQEGQNGFSFDPFDILEMSELIQHMSSDKADRKIMGEKSYEIIQDYSPEAFSDSLWNAAHLAVKTPNVRTQIASKSLLWAFGNI